VKRIVAGLSVLAVALVLTVGAWANQREACEPCEPCEPTAACEPCFVCP
jgi:hypothetical protein